jgi:molybdate/tungstate transport system ATP-binding protein
MHFFIWGSIIMNDLVIKMDKMGFSYGKNEVIYMDNLSITKGITTVFLGSNGSGKTTLLKLLSGLFYPSKGLIIPDPQILKKESVLVHQSPYLFSGSVRYNIELGLRLKKTPAKLRNIISREVLTEARLLHLNLRKTSSLSGGERKRLAIARALALNPETLILDEPFANIDPESRELIENLIIKRTKDSKTTILSTHNLVSAYRLADNIIYLDNGKTRSSETNFLKGSVVKKDDYFCSFQSTGDKEGIAILSPASDGEYRAAVIPYSDIFLSRDRNKTSAQNQLKGKITSLVKKGSQFYVTIDCGIILKAIITDLSVTELQIKEGKSIFVNFKASAVRLY